MHLQVGRLDYGLGFLLDEIRPLTPPTYSIQFHSHNHNIIINPFAGFQWMGWSCSDLWGSMSEIEAYITVESWLRILAMFEIRPWPVYLRYLTLQYERLNSKQGQGEMCWYLQNRSKLLHVSDQYHTKTRRTIKISFSDHTVPYSMEHTRQQTVRSSINSWPVVANYDAAKTYTILSQLI